jgi:hypothetical protein
MLVACCLLNRTTGLQARPALASLLHRWRTPGELACADGRSLRPVLRPLGLWRRRAVTLKRLSAAWAAGERNPSKMPGVGEYALASWSIFVEGKLPKTVNDNKLKLYVSWRKRRERLRRE